MREILFKGKRADNGEWVQVVRCKDCIHHNTYIAEDRICDICDLFTDYKNMFMIVDKEHFCGYGERGERKERKNDSHK